MDKTNKPDGFYLRDEFITWLKEEHQYTPGSANSYASYVATANKNILTEYLKDDSFFELVREAVNQSADKSNIEELIDRLIGIVIKEARQRLYINIKAGVTTQVSK